MRALLLLPMALAIGSAAAPDAKKVDELFAPVAGGKLPGAAVAVILDGHPVLVKGYGMADVARSKAISPATIFRLASVTKTFTAIAVLQLVEAGKVKLDDTISQYVADIPGGAKIRVSHLLGHTAGIPDFIGYDEMKRRSLEFEPGSRINYSNNGYGILGHLIERVSGQTWDGYLREHILAPLGMKNSGYDVGGELPGRATGYLLGKNGYEASSITDARDAYAGGGLYSTVDDLVRFEQGLLAGKLLKRETLERAWRPGTLTDGRTTAYGFGWIVTELGGVREVGHGGDITGFNTYLAHYPDQKLTVIVLSNTGMRPPGPLPLAVDLAHAIAAIWLGDAVQKTAAPVSARVPAETLDAYVGRYRIDAPEAVTSQMGTHIVVTRQGDRLFAEAGGMKAPIDAKSETVFQAAGSPVVLTFVRSGPGKCPALTITLMGLREFRAARVE
jgi:D-alanyl-D-alanine carboxypeptidase